MGPYDEVIWASPGFRYSCAWDYGRSRVLQQPVETMQFVGRATFKISDNHQMYFEAVGSEVESRRHFEAQQISTSVSTALNSLDPYPLNDLTRSTYDMVYNALADYFGTANLVYGNPINYRWRCYACGPREYTTTTKASRLMFGFEGTIAGWDYNAGLSRSSSRAESVLTDGYYYTPQLKEMLRTGLLNPFLCRVRISRQQHMRRWLRPRLVACNSTTARRPPR